MTLFRIKGEDHEVSEKAVLEATAWMADYFGMTLESILTGDYSGYLSDSDILAVVARNYDGGIEAFLRNNS